MSKKASKTGSIEFCFTLFHVFSMYANKFDNKKDGIIARSVVLFWKQ